MSHTVAWKLERSPCPCLMSAGITGMCYHTKLRFYSQLSLLPVHTVQVMLLAHLTPGLHLKSPLQSVGLMSFTCLSLHPSFPISLGSLFTHFCLP